MEETMFGFPGRTEVYFGTRTMALLKKGPSSKQLREQLNRLKQCTASCSERVAEPVPQGRIITPLVLK
ncbi:MAG: hypothetical protein D6719_06355 [Candidatus Dadabacteria bacterium]|nr:MAG: hypothetical protein D6719_06355 [Candidatus Dadabacteria bacterium]